MKIHRDGPQDNHIEQAQTARHTERVARGLGSLQSSNARQIGLDRIDVSDVAETAGRVLGDTSAERAARVKELAQLYQAGQYVVDASKLSQSIIDHDLESDLPGHES